MSTIDASPLRNGSDHLRKKILAWARTSCTTGARFAVILAGALIVAAGAVSLVEHRTINQTRELVVATRDIAAGEYISSEQITATRTVPELQVEGGYVTRDQAALGLRAAVDVRAGQPLVASAVVYDTDPPAVATVSDTGPHMTTWIRAASATAAGLLLLGALNAFRRTRHVAAEVEILRPSPNSASAAPRRRSSGRQEWRRRSRVPLPRVLSVSTETIELIWNTPNPAPTGVWTSTDGGWSWTARTNSISADLRSALRCPTLIDVGSIDDASIMLNLESCGAVALIGTHSDVEQFAGAILTELSSIANSTGTRLVHVGQDCSPDPSSQTAMPILAAIDLMYEHVRHWRDLTARLHVESIYELRLRTTTAIAALVVIINPANENPEDVATLLGLVNGDLGAIVIVAGKATATTWQLNIEADHVDVEPLSLRVHRHPTPAVSFDSVSTTRDQLESHVFAAGVEPSRSETKWDVELKVLGQVRAIGTSPALTKTELHLAIFLAFHRNGESADTIATMIWPDGAADRTITNTMTSLRRKLGCDPNGVMLFPLGRDHQYTYLLSNRVVTDWDRFLALVERADHSEEDLAAQLLDEALALVDGPPFRASHGYSWAFNDGTATLIARTIRTVAERRLGMNITIGHSGQALHLARRSLDMVES